MKLFLSKEESKELRSALSTAHLFLGKETSEARKIINGVTFEINNGGISVCSTDGFAGITRKLETKSDVSFPSFILNKDMLKAIQKITTQSNPISYIEVENRLVSFGYETFVISGESVSNPLRINVTNNVVISKLPNTINKTAHVTINELSDLLLLHDNDEQTCFIDEHNKLDFSCLHSDSVKCICKSLVDVKMLRKLLNGMKTMDKDLHISFSVYNGRAISIAIGGFSYCQMGIKT